MLLSIRKNDKLDNRKNITEEIIEKPAILMTFFFFNLNAKTVISARMP